MDPQVPGRGKYSFNLTNLLFDPIYTCQSLSGKACIFEIAVNESYFTNFWVVKIWQKKVKVRYLDFFDLN